MAWGQIGLALSPMRVDLGSAAGLRHNGSLALSNDSSARIRVRAEAMDFYIDATGTPQFGRDFPREAAQSCRTWLALNPMEMELDIGRQLQVRYTLQVPPGTREGAYHCAASFTTMPLATEGSRSGLRTAVRVVTVFYPVVGTPPIQGSLKTIVLEPVTGTPFRFNAVVIMENTGRMHFRPQGRLMVLDAEGKTLDSNKFQPLPVLPEREQRFVFPLKAELGNGPYRLRAQVDIGTDELQEATVVVVPPEP